MNQMAASFGTYFFDQVFLTPTVIDAGVVLQSDEFVFELWHSHEAPQALAAVSVAGDEGVELQGATAGSLEPFKTYSYRVSFNQDFSGLVDYSAGFDFGFGIEASFSLTASLATIIDERIDWSTQPELRIQYMTEVIEAFDGTEQRISLRDKPRASLSYMYSLADEQQYRFDNKIGSTSGRMIVPAWQLQCNLDQSVKAGDGQLVLSNMNASVEAASIVLISEGDQYEILSVESAAGNAVTLKNLVKRNFSAGAIVVPAYIAYTADESDSKSFVRSFDQRTITFDLDEELYNKPALVDDFERFNCRPVFSFRADRSKDVTTQYKRLREVLDSGIGVRSIFERAAGSVRVFSQSFTFFSESDRQRFEDFAELMSGAQGEFYFEGPGQAFELAEDVYDATYQLKIKSSGYSGFNKSPSFAPAVIVKLYNGSCIYRTILSAQKNAGGTETVVTKETTQDLKASDIEYIAPLYLARFESDDFLYIFDTSEVSTITKNIRQLLYADSAVDSESTLTL